LYFLAVPVCHASADASISGTVVDRTAGILVSADVAILTLGNIEVARTQTDTSGRFELTGIPPGTYVLLVERRGFAEQRHLVSISSTGNHQIELSLDVRGPIEAITVTPVRGVLNEVGEVPELVTVTPSDRLARRAYSVFPQALREEVGVSVQQTSTSQASPFIRGLTGQQVVNLVDGVRFNNATFRPGANQYTALIDPVFVSRVEIVRGPHSTQYGSDALGGTVNVVTPSLRTFDDGFGVRGTASGSFGTADLASGGAANVSFGSRGWGVIVGGASQRVRDLRTGQGIDSHSVVTRLLGLSSKVLGSRLADTGYTQHSANARVVYRPTGNDSVSLTYLHSAQLGASRYDQLDGGLGNLLHRFDPQLLNLAVARYERLETSILDSFSVAWSFNRQRDDRRFQNINNRQGLQSRITDETNQVNVFGYQIQAARAVAVRQRISFGADLYDEHVSSRRIENSVDPSTGAFTNFEAVRARFPNGTTYRTVGLFAQDTIALPGDRASASVGVRYSRFRYDQSSGTNPSIAAGPTVPAYAADLGDVTYNAGFVYQATEHVTLNGMIARGFRAPNVNDFGTIGISGGGFEISPDEGARLGGLAARTGTLGDPSPIGQLAAEELFNYEGGVRLASRRFGATLATFHSVIQNSIERRTVLLPAGSVGSSIGGQPIIRQDFTGAVYTALAGTPVFVRANGGRVRLAGAEGSAWLRLPHDLRFDVNLSYVRGTNLETGHPPDLENGIPPATGFAAISWEPPNRAFWLEAYTHFAATQHRLSQNDRQQARIGGQRTAQEIVDFFGNGAVARGLVHSGRLEATGETVDQVVQRVIGSDPTARVLLFTTNPGFATMNFRGGLRLSAKSDVVVILENALDKNYRVIGSGIDGSGINLMLRYSARF
jgi:outer membrane receptor protein involved in Fe transport